MKEPQPNHTNVEATGIGWYTNIFNIQSLLWLALALALAGSLKHLAAIFASVDGNLWFGWLQAIAVDVGLFALAYSLKTRKADRRSTRPLWTGVVLFTGISVYGNLAYGVLALEGELWPVLKWPQPFILSSTLPILVLFLAELISDDRQHAAGVAEKEAKRAAKRETTGEMPDSLGKANEARMSKMEVRRQEVAALVSSGLSPADIAGQLEVSERTIRRDIETLSVTQPADIPGTVARNGHPVNRSE